MAVDIVIPTRVKSVEQKSQVLSIKKTGAKTEDGKDELRTETQDLGWFVHFEGSWESLYTGSTKPDLERGDLVDIIIRKRRK